MPNALIGFLRGLGFFLIMAVLSYIGVAEHLSFLNPVTAGLIASLALSLEHALSPVGTGLGGTVKRT